MTSQMSFPPKMGPVLVPEGFIKSGKFVILNTGEIAEIAEIDANELFQPVIVVIINDRNKPLRYPIRVMLARDDQRWIERVIQDKIVIQKLLDIKQEIEKTQKWEKEE